MVRCVVVGGCGAFSQGMHSARAPPTPPSPGPPALACPRRIDPAALPFEVYEAMGADCSMSSAEALSSLATRLPCDMYAVGIVAFELLSGVTAVQVGGLYVGEVLKEASHLALRELKPHGNRMGIRMRNSSYIFTPHPARPVLPGCNSEAGGGLP